MPLLRRVNEAGIALPLRVLADEEEGDKGKVREFAEYHFDEACTARRS
jgi:hypothetical protein